uniref:DOG1 domain-containing protein n=1 Tax=Kalanchoe fedtschenkoi TaxID=63787 RepID=A0A7N0UAA2_KALFE
MHRSNPNAASTFGAFFDGWLIRQEAFLEELQSTIDHPDPKESAEDEAARLGELVARVSAHYQEYYHAKSRAAQDSIFLVFSPTWLTPFEKTFLWIAGFKPGLAFHLVTTFVPDLEAGQRSRLEEARAESRLEERELSEELARIQETIAAPPMLELARRAAVAVDGEQAGLESALDALKQGLEMLLECADFLRLKTVMRIMEILQSSQNVIFFAAVARFQLQVRRWGLEREAAAAATG